MKINPSRVAYFGYVGIIIILYSFFGVFIFNNYEALRNDYNFLHETLNIDNQLGFSSLFLLFDTMIGALPIPQLIPFTAIYGFLFGVRDGMIYGIIATFVTTYVIVSYSKKFTHSPVLKYVEKKYKKYFNVIRNADTVLLFIIYFFPLFPNSIVSWILGYSKFSPLKAASIVTIAQIPGISISVLIGNGLFSQNWTQIALTYGGYLLLMIFIYFTKDKVRSLISRKQKELKEEISI